METVQLSHKEFLKIDKDYIKAAKVADLTYVTDKTEGIQRQKKREFPVSPLLSNPAEVSLFLI